MGGSSALWWLAALGSVTSQPPLACVDAASGDVIVRAEDVLEVDADVVPPRAISRVEPDLSPEQRRAFGLVVVEATLDRSGQVCAVRVLKAATPELGNLFAAAIRRWTFEPATRDGRPVPVRYFLSSYFHPH